MNGNPYDMSFSGLKTAVVNLAHTAKQRGEELDLPSLAAAICRAVSDTLLSRALLAAEEKGYGKLAIAGGVSANTLLRADLEAACARSGLRAYCAPLSLCGDNAAMIGCQGYYEYLAGTRADSSLNAYATMSPDSALIRW